MQHGSVGNLHAWLGNSAALHGKASARELSLYSVKHRVAEHTFAVKNEDGIVGKRCICCAYMLRIREQIDKMDSNYWFYIKKYIRVPANFTHVFPEAKDAIDIYLALRSVHWLA